MKKIYFLLCLSGFVFLSCSESDSSKNESKSALSDSAKIEFLNTVHDFGVINEGEKVSTVYKFKNVGSMPLEIFNVEVSCGCTVAEKPEKPVGAGQTGEIKVEFNSTGKVGVNKKFVTIVSNATNATEIVSFNVTVNKINENK